VATTYKARCRVRGRDRSPLKLVVSTPTVEDEFDRLVEIVSDVDAAAKALTPEERKAYVDQQRSVVEARRSAEVHEGLLQLK
jgi:hypothetical protein